MSSGRRVVLASNNPGKLREIKAIFRDLDFELAPQSDFNVPGVAETGDSFVANALFGADQDRLVGDVFALPCGQAMAVEGRAGTPRIVPDGVMTPAFLQPPDRKLAVGQHELRLDGQSIRLYCPVAKLDTALEISF